MNTEIFFVVCASVFVVLWRVLFVFNRVPLLWCKKKNKRIQLNQISRNANSLNHLHANPGEKKNDKLYLSKCSAN